jgi:Tfp pilus assembly protein FimT
MNNDNKAIMKGLTAIELLIITSVIALIVVFATPMMNAVFAKSDLDRAIEITEQSIHKARVAARLYDTNVVMRVEADQDMNPHSITILIPGNNRDILLGEWKEEFVLPDSVRIVSGNMLINFDSEGEVDFPAKMLIASNREGFKQKKFIIQ